MSETSYISQDNLQAGKESPQAFKAQQQVTEKLLPALGGELETRATQEEIEPGRVLHLHPPPLPPAELVLPWIHRTHSSLQFFLGFKEAQTFQN